MPFWTYMIQCGDRHFYVGHTNNLEQRIGEHHAGTFQGYTSTRQPLHLVWSEEFPTRNDALEAERRLKGWSRAKKLALIRGDWVLISALARSRKEEGRASTGSAQTRRGRLVHSGYLYPHQAQPPSEPFNLEVAVSRAHERLRVRFSLNGPVGQLSIPVRTISARRDGLWEHTCFEVFVQSQGDTYLEFNLSPSTEWAAYRFDGYRDGMVEFDAGPPKIAASRRAYALRLNAEIELPEDFTPTRLGLSAVIEELSGRKSYWALAHPPGDKPDFHHPDCFALELPPATNP